MVVMFCFLFCFLFCFFFLLLVLIACVCFAAFCFLRLISCFLFRVFFTSCFVHDLMTLLRRAVD